MGDLQRTPLYDFHKRHGGRIVPFAGWELPVQYTGILEEHRAVRQAAGLFDVSHMGEISVAGPGALDYLQHLLTNDLTRLRTGGAIYSLMCQPDGGCVDDIICYQRGEGDYLLCVNASNADKDFAWMREHAAGFECAVENRSPDYAQIAVQGPRAWDVLAAAGCSATPESLKRFNAVDGTVGGIAALISRTGYTGEDGAELYCAPADAEALAEALLAAGRPLGLVLAGLGARDSLRLEAGLPLYGHEIGPATSPLQAGLGWAVKLGKTADFTGREALRAEAAAGPTRRLVHYILEGRRIAREGAEVFAAGRLVGRVCSGTFSPMLERPIGSALVEATADVATLHVDFRGTAARMEVKKAPLHK